ncbi:MAG: S1C family serine protease [Candidatus Brocadiia bacterium]
MRPYRALRALALLLALLAPPAWAAEGAKDQAHAVPDVPAIVQQRANAVVRVETFEAYLPGLARRTGRLLNPFPLRKTLEDAVSFAVFIPSAVVYPMRRHLGSGVLISPEGQLLTNYHVVKDADRLTVRLTDAEGVRRRFDAQVVGEDRETDVALLRIEPGEVPLVVAPLGDSEEMKLGDWIVAIGNPINLTGSVTVGVVSGLHRQLETNPLEDYIQVSAGLNPGNSGGPILNARGQVVGIVALGVFPANNIGFAVPTSLIRPVLDDLRRHGRPRRGHLGVVVRDLTPELAEERDLERESGALVADVSLFSPAGEAGIREGDVVVAYGGEEMASARDLQAAVLRTAPGTEVPVALERDGRRVEVRVRVGLRRRPFRIL